MLKHPVRQARRHNRAASGPADQSARIGMCRMPLHHNGTTSGESRGGVAADSGESERKVRRAEYSDRAKRDHALSKIRARHWLAIGQSGIKTQTKPLTAPHDIGKHLELADRAAPLAFEPRAGQAGFSQGRFDQRFADRADLLPDPLEKARAVLAAGVAINFESRFSGGASLAD